MQSRINRAPVYQSSRADHPSFRTHFVSSCTDKSSVHRWTSRAPVFDPGADYWNVGERPRGERRSGFDRRQATRVARCSNCNAYLRVDRRGPTVQLFSAVSYRPAATLLHDTEEAAMNGAPRCPICSAALWPTETERA